MKTFLLRIKNIKKDFVSFRKINPHNHWKMLLYVFFTLTIILIFFSFYLLFEINGQQIFQVTTKPVETTSLINEKLLKKVTESFNLKLIKEKEIKEGLTSYKDPSI